MFLPPYTPVGRDPVGEWRKRKKAFEQSPSYLTARNLQLAEKNLESWKKENIHVQ